MDRVYIKYDPKKNLRTNEYIISNQREKEVKALACAVYGTNKAKNILNTSHKELLLWNFRLVHIWYQHVQKLIHTGILKVQGNPKAMSNYERTECSGCYFRKGHRRPNKINTTMKKPVKEGELKKDLLLPGKIVSAYHYILQAKCRIYHTKGKSDPYDIFRQMYFY